MSEPHRFSLSDLEAALQAQTLPAALTPRALAHVLQTLCRSGLDDLPLPGQGNTLVRWRALARVAAFDLSLCKLYEGHTDARAIMHHWAAPAIPSGSTWGMWAAEPPQARVTVRTTHPGDGVYLQGVKAWCSGAATVSHALLTAWNPAGQQQLMAVALDQPGVHVTGNGWQAVGMAATQSVEVQFDGAQAHPVGPPGGYLARAGFWHGGAGIAACWFGSAQVIAEALRKHCTRSEDPHGLAHLGAVDYSLHCAANLLRDTAHWIDRHPTADALLPAQRLRAQCEHSAEQVISHVGRALGAIPYCRDAHLARHLCDLPVYLRQSHAERDRAALGAVVARERPGSWLP